MGIGLQLIHEVPVFVVELGVEVQSLGTIGSLNNFGFIIGSCHIESEELGALYVKITWTDFHQASVALDRTACELRSEADNSCLSVSEACLEVVVGGIDHQRNLDIISSLGETQGELA